MIAAAVARTTSGSSAHDGASRKNGCSAAVGVEQQQRALAEVVEQQRRQHQREPGEADRPLAEVAHVGVERLAAGDDRTTAPSTTKPCQPLSPKERDACRGLTAPRTTGALTIQLTPSTRDARRTRPPSPGRTAGRRGACRAAGSRTAPIRITTVSGTTYGSNSGVATSAFDRAEHRDRRRDHAVAVEQRGAEDAEQRSARSARRRCRSRARQQRGQREDAAFALVVGAHHDRDVLDRDRR